MDRVTERISWARRALEAFRPFAHRARPTSEQRDIAMLRFLLAFETTWKAAQALLKEREGREEGSPKSCIRACREIGVLSDPDAERALAMSDDRNLISHTYDEPLAAGIFKRLGSYADLADRWVDAIAERGGVVTTPPGDRAPVRRSGKRVQRGHRPPSGRRG